MIARAVNWAGALCLLTGALLLSAASAALGAEEAPSAGSEQLAALPGASASVHKSSTGEEWLPLRATAARHGVVVVITKSDIHVIRRDGNQVRLKGLQPETASVPLAMAQTPRQTIAIIRDGEAWVRSEDVAELLAPAGERREPREESGAERSFETFEVQKPVVTALAPPASGGERVPRPLQSATIEARPEPAWRPPEISPAALNLGFSRSLAVSEPGLRGFYQDFSGTSPESLDERRRHLAPGELFSPSLSYLHLELWDQAGRYEIGDVHSPLFGTATALSFSSSLSDHLRAGASVIQPTAAPGQRTEGHLAVTAQHLAAGGLKTEAAAASNGSYHASLRWDRPEFSLRSSLLERPTLRQQDLSWRARALPAWSLCGRTSEIAGDSQGRFGTLGLAWDRGRWHARAERAQADFSGRSQVWDEVSASFFRRGLTGIARYLVRREGGGRSGLEWTVSLPGTGGRYVFLSSSAPDAEASARAYRLGLSSAPRRNLRTRVALAWEGRRLHPECSLEFRPTRDQVMALRYGSFNTGLPGAGLDTGLILQAALAFGGPGSTRAGIGHIRGQVRDDWGLGVPDVVVLLDDRETAVTGSDGRYSFRGVVEGPHTVALDPNRIPTDLGAVSRPRRVFVAGQKAEEADFAVTRLCQIKGRVYVESPSSRRQEPLPGITVELGSGQRTVTDELGRYVFSGLAQGSYTVRIPEEATVPGLIPVPPASWSFRLGPGDTAEDANFSFRKQERPVIFSQLPAAK